MEALGHQVAVHKFTLSHSAKILLTFCASACFETSEMQKVQNHLSIKQNLECKMPITYEWTLLCVYLLWLTLSPSCLKVG